MGLVHTGQGGLLLGSGVGSHGAVGFLLGSGAPELTPSSTKCCWCIVGYAWCARHVAFFLVGNCRRYPCRPQIRVRQLLGKAVTIVQSRNDIKVLDLGSNKVKLDQQVKSTEMGGRVDIEGKGRRLPMVLLGNIPTRVPCLGVNSVFYLL